MRDTLSREFDRRFGEGISVQADPATGGQSELSVRRALVAGNRGVGVIVLGA